MLLEYHGHSEFLLTDDAGTRLLTDPYDGSVGYPIRPIRAEAVTVSHGHFDHSYTDKVTGAPVILRAAGSFSPAPDVYVTAIPCFHDDERGAHRGNNLMMRIEMDGVVVLHAGDLGHLPDEELLKKIGQVDLLLLPVGGFYTLGPKEAKEAAALIHPRTVIPMHYRTQATASWPIWPADEFLDEMNASRAEREEVPVLRVEKHDLSEQPRIAVMKVR